MPPGEMHRQRRSRNFALAGALFVMVVIFFVVSIVKMSGLS